MVFHTKYTRNVKSSGSTCGGCWRLYGGKETFLLPGTRWKEFTYPRKKILVHLGNFDQSHSSMWKARSCLLSSRNRWLLFVLENGLVKISVQKTGGPCSPGCLEHSSMIWHTRGKEAVGRFKCRVVRPCKCIWISTPCPDRVCYGFLLDPRESEKVRDEVLWRIPDVVLNRIVHHTVGGFGGWHFYGMYYFTNLVCSGYGSYYEGCWEIWSWKSIQWRARATTYTCFHGWFDLSFVQVLKRWWTYWPNVRSWWTEENEVQNQEVTKFGSKERKTC